MASRLTILAAFLAISALAGAARGQIGTLATVNGKVNDLARTSGGALLYCTEQGDVGRIATNGAVTLLANAASGPFPNPLRGVAEIPGGDVAIADSEGHIYRLPSSGPPAVKVYDDLYMVLDCTDLIVDAAGNFVLASLTPSVGTRGLNWVSPDGTRFAYYVVQHAPIAVAADPLTGNLVIADEANNGALRYVVVSDDSHPTVPLDTAAQPGFSAANGDGDLAFEANGNILYVAGGSLLRFNRASGQTATLTSGLPQLRGIAIAASSGAVASPSGWSAYLASGPGPTAIREVGGVGAPANPVSPSLGFVPGRGTQVFLGFGMNAYELAVDRDGNLLVGGDTWGVGQAVKRLTLPSLQLTSIAGAADGLAGRVEGIAQDPDGSLLALSSNGVIQRIQESPLSLTTVYSDAQNKIITAKDLVFSRDGSLYVAHRGGYGWGDVYRVTVKTGTAIPATPSVETRGLCADPFTARLLYSEWQNVGFVGTVATYDPAGGGAMFVPGFAGMNYTNAEVWGDGDVVQDVQGNIYTCSEDDFSVHRFNRYTGKLVRIASGYLSHPGGLAIARSTPLTPSPTGFSLYVAEFDRLWEIGGVPAPAPTRIDPGAPPVGRCAGFLLSGLGVPRAIAREPGGSGLLVSTDAGKVVRLDPNNGALSTVAAAPQGISGDLVALAPKPNGHLLAASRAGAIYDLDPGAGYAASVVWSNAAGTLVDVRGLCADGLGRPIVVDRKNGAHSKVWRVNGGQLELLAFSARGVRPAIDPLTGDVFVSEEGNAGEAGGELLRIQHWVSPPQSGHYQGNAFATYPVGPFDGALAFDSQGNLYVAAGNEGRIRLVTRSSAATSTKAANYERPVGLALAPGTPGTAGPQGTSLYVLDGFAVFEVGVDGSPAPSPNPTPPGLAPPAALRVAGFAATGATIPVRLESPADANRLYLVVGSLSGKVPGFPLSSVFDPNDPRSFPSNPDDVWAYVNTWVMPQFFATLDGAGKSPPSMAIVLPNDPTILGIQRFLDLAWIAFDPAFQSGVSTIGGTAQLYLGN